MSEAVLKSDLDLKRAERLHGISLTSLIFSVRRLPLLLWDLLSIVVAFNVFTQWSPYFFAEMRGEAVFFSVFFALAFTCVGMISGYYDRIQRFALSNIVAIGMLNGLAAFALSTLTTYFWFYTMFGRLTVIWGFIGSMSVILASRMAMREWLISHPFRFTVLGQSAWLTELCDRSIGKEYNRLYNFIVLDLPPENPIEIVERLVEQQIGVLAIASGAIDDHTYVELALAAYRRGIHLIDEIEFYAEIFERIPVEAVSKRWILSEGIGQRRIMFEALQRGIDILTALISLIILAPLFFTIIILIKLSSPGSAFFVQPRMGRYGVPFRMYKFRTMFHASCDALAKQGFTQQGDVRVTWVGRRLRPLHLDELPQLINILLGDMSIVGPRPEAIPFARRMVREIQLYELRYLVRPGLTGHAQLMHGYALDNVEDTKRKLSYDLFYLAKYSALLNMRLVFRTIPYIAKGAR